jgi:hypothetical protein
MGLLPAASWGLPPQATPNAQGNYLPKAILTATAKKMTTPKTLTKTSGPYYELYYGIGKLWQHSAYSSAKGVLTSFDSHSDGTITAHFNVRPDSSLMPESVWSGPQHFLETMRLIEPHAPAQAPIDLSRYPHVCPRCGSRAYVGGVSAVDCLNMGGNCPTKAK